MSNCVTAIKSGVRIPAGGFAALSGALGCRNAAMPLQGAATAGIFPAPDSHVALKRVVAGEVAA